MPFRQAALNEVDKLKNMILFLLAVEHLNMDANTRFFLVPQSVHGVNVGSESK
jgi:hypothetical protein